MYCIRVKLIRVYDSNTLGVEERLHAEMVAREIESHAETLARRAASPERAAEALGEQLRLVAMKKRK